MTSFSDSQSPDDLGTNDQDSDKQSFEETNPKRAVSSPSDDSINENLDQAIEGPEAPALPSSFSEIISDPSLLEILQAHNFTIPTPVQVGALPLAIEGRDLVVQAQTGSGKTLAYLLPLLLRLKEVAEKGDVTQTFGLVVTPTRELALQVHEVLTKLDSSLAPVCLIGGVDIKEQQRGLKKDPRVVIGTPGRILDMQRQRFLSLKHCRFFVLDEADEMLSMGFLEDVRAILSRLPDKRQGLFVSATITPRVDMLANSFLTKPEQIRVAAVETEAPLIEHLYCEVGGDLMAKPHALCDLIETLRPRSSIIFCNTKSDTQLVEALLRRRGFDARRINSDLTQSQRERVMQKIRAGDLQFLVATDIAARGIDIAQIELVFNYAIHEQPEIYVHRTGRTGRAGHHGRAMSLVGPLDFGSFHYLTKALDIKFEKIPLPSQEEVADARLAHLYEVLRKAKVDAKDTDLVVAKKLIHELGTDDEPSEEFVTIVSKLCRHTIEHYIQLEAKSLEDEIEGGEGDERRPKSGDDRKREGRRNDKDNDRRGQDSRSRGGRDRDDSRRDSSPRSSSPRDSSPRDSSPRNDSRRNEREGDRRGRDSRGSRDGERRERNDDRRPSPGDNRRQDDRPQRRNERGREDSRSRDRGPRNENRTRRDDSPSDEVRLYIGQGTAEGMSPEVFTDLAVEFGELKAEDLRNLTIREHYGFVDAIEPKASQLTKNLNGIEYNGQTLPVEFATVIANKRGRRPARRSDVHENQRNR